jgi:hypothetical protein
VQGQLIINYDPSAFFDRRERSKSTKQVRAWTRGCCRFRETTSRDRFRFFFVVCLFVCLREDHPNFESVASLFDPPSRLIY